MISKSTLDLFPDNSVNIKYNVANLPIFVCMNNLADFPDHATPPHWSAGMETLYIKEGIMEITVNGNMHLLRSGDLCIINSGCVHYLKSHNSQDCIYYCSIVEESLFSTASDIVSNYINPMFHAFHPDIEIIRSDSPYSSSIRQVLGKIYKLIEEKPIAYGLRIVAAFHEYLALLCETLHDSFFLPSSAGSKNDSIMKLLINYIQKNYAHPISISQLCKISGISRYQCFNIFEKYTGDTPKSFLLKYRLNESKKLLTSSDASIAKIALSCGFNHQSHYSNHFSKHYGITPLKYRKKYIS